MQLVHWNYHRRSKCNCRIHIVVSEFVANLNISENKSVVRDIQIVLYGTLWKWSTIWHKTQMGDTSATLPNRCGTYQGTTSTTWLNFYAPCKSQLKNAWPVSPNVSLIPSYISPVYIWPTSSEPGLTPSLARCLAPIRACLHYRGRAPRQLDHQYAAALNLRHVVRVLIAFLQFLRCHRCIRWLVCNNYENSNFKKFFDVALFVNSRRHNSVDVLSALRGHCCVVVLEKCMTFENCDGIIEILESNSCASQCE